MCGCGRSFCTLIVGGEMRNSLKSEKPLRRNSSFSSLSFQFNTQSLDSFFLFLGLFSLLILSIFSFQYIWVYKKLDLTIKKIWFKVNHAEHEIYLYGLGNELCRIFYYALYSRFLWCLYRINHSDSFFPS